ncbi:hypothetical protein Afe04nite_20750 [Asanoa ferruginea]|uniref:hypothetical protein n=1 Tax=Asanoa ferruginea TaxID=53367 RepID=UPI000E252F41|nr:hypothetical protein [Asanoa ferruginea]GIF47536.1 hypothetical protein Afe04nite_20750 [Asanoa ferruginea]
MKQPTAVEVAQLLGADLTALPLAHTADVAAAEAGVAARDSLPCIGCGAPGKVMLVARTPLGNRWVDVCYSCFALTAARR